MHRTNASILQSHLQADALIYQSGLTKSNHSNITDLYKVKEKSLKHEVQTALRLYSHLPTIPDGPFLFFLSAEEQPFDESI